jgi:hypothetical protein
MHAHRCHARIDSPLDSPCGRDDARRDSRVSLATMSRACRELENAYRVDLRLIYECADSISQLRIAKRFVRDPHRRHGYGERARSIRDRRQEQESRARSTARNTHADAAHLVV